MSGFVRDRRSLRAAVVLVTTSLVWGLALVGEPARAAAGDTTRVSVAPDATQGNSASSAPYASADGRYVAFPSYAGNLVAGDTNNTWDVFRRDTLTGDVVRVSVATGGTQANYGSPYARISGNGRYIAFGSDASNLVPGDTNGQQDVFLHDTVTGTTTRVSVSTSGAQGGSQSSLGGISGDGHYVTFHSYSPNFVAGDTNGQQDVFVRDTATGTTTRASVTAGGAQANLSSYSSHVSESGRYVAFYSYASNLVAGDGNGAVDAFVRDTVAATTTRVSMGTGGTQANSDSYQPVVSRDGRYIAFYSQATNLVAGDTNGALDVFVRDTVADTTTRVSVGPGGVQANGRSDYPGMSGGGRYVVFNSEATNLVPGDTNGRTDVFLYDLATGITTRTSVATDGTQGDGHSQNAAMSTNAAVVLFSSEASALVPGDTNGVADAFAHDTGVAENLPPTAAFSWAPDPLTQWGVLLDASGSGDLDGTVAQYHWDFGDGATSDAAGAATSHAYAAPGIYTVTLTVTDDEGATGMTAATATVDVPDGRPVTRVLAVDAVVGEATVRADVKRLSFFGFFDFYLGVARVTDAPSDVVTWGLVLAPAGGVAPTGLNGAAFTAFSLDTRALPWRTGRLAFTVDARDALAGGGPDTVTVTGTGDFAGYSLSGPVATGDISVTH